MSGDEQTADVEAAAGAAAGAPAVAVELRAAGDGSVANQTLPERLLQVKALPKAASGKVQK